jgi:hypothetical protein
VNQDEVVGRVVAALVEVGVPYMIAGSFASNLHGVPRMTQDADIVIDADDAVGLIQVQDPRLDWPYLQRWATDLGVSHLLERARRAGPFKG